MIFLKQSLTGRYNYFLSDAGLEIVRLDYSPNQPRDSRGRFASGGGSGGGGGGGGGSRKSGGGGGSPLLQQRVSTLQQMAREAGIDPDTLSHKARKSVLVAAIEAKQSGKDLREQGLLKPTKPKPSRGASSVKTPLAVGATTVKMTGDNAILSTSKTEFNQLYSQWKGSDKTANLIGDYLSKKNNLGQLGQELGRQIESAKSRGAEAFSVPKGVELPRSLVASNRRFHQQNKSLIEEDAGGGVTTFGSKFSPAPIAAVIPERSGGLSVRMTGNPEARMFKTRKEAEDFAKQYTQNTLASRVFPTEKAQAVQDAMKSDKGLGKLEKALNRQGVSDLSEESLNRIVDNNWIHQSLKESLKDSDVVAIKDKRGNLQAALSYSEMSEGRGLYVDYLATSPWNAARSSDPRVVSGAGARAIAEAAKISQQKGYDGTLTLNAVRGAVPFYQRIGFEVVDGDFVLSPNKAKELISRYG